MTPLRMMPDLSDQDPHSALLRSYKVSGEPRPSPPLINSLYLSIQSMGVTIERIRAGDGTTYPKLGDKVTIHYVGTLENGTKFDSSRDRGDPFQTEIGIGKVIKGWDEGVPQLSLGEKAILIASPDYAYGVRGFPPVIPPNAILRFEVELLKIN